MDQSFWDANGDEISAAITMAITVAIAIAVDRFVLARARHVADRFARGRRLARGPDAAPARPPARLRDHPRDRRRAGAEPVRAAREARDRDPRLQRRARARPRVRRAPDDRQLRRGHHAGDHAADPDRRRITFEDETGRVDDITLSYTYIDTGDGRLMVVPNESLASGTLFNHSTGDQSAPVAASVWLPPDADLGRARLALEPRRRAGDGRRDHRPRACDSRSAPPARPTRTRAGGEEAALRERAQSALREAGAAARSAR